MDLNAAAAKHKKEQEQRRLEAKRKLDLQKRAQEEADERDRAREEARAVRDAEERAARERVVEEYARNGGVRLSLTLRPVPVVREDDKLILPPSALEALERQDALVAGVPLTFQVARGGVASAGVTHAGVAEFTAEEGTVGVPPKVALCLTKASGLDALEEQVGVVVVTYSRLERSEKCHATIQPKGVGFHLEGQDVVNLDLQKVLERALRAHTTLTEGDWLPVRHEGRSYELVVRTLEPEAALCLINTDLEVQILPSEQAEAERLALQAAKRALEERERRKQEREAARRLHAEKKAASLPPEPPDDPSTTLRVVLRLPSGATRSRRLPREASLRLLLDWVESEWEGTFAERGRYKLVQSWPGHRREFGELQADSCLKTLGLVAKQEALFLQRDGEIVEEEADAPMPDVAGSGTVGDAPTKAPTASSSSSAWADAEKRLVERSAHEEHISPTAAMREEPKLEKLEGKALVEVFHLLLATGLKPQEAATVSQKWAAQLKELMSMGFSDVPAMVALLERYNGRVFRVADSLAESLSTVDASIMAPAAAASAAEAPAAAPAVAIAAPSDSVDLWRTELVQLEGMGFSDVSRNVELLQKYQGRLERVVNVLCGAD